MAEDDATLRLYSAGNWPQIVRSVPSSTVRPSRVVSVTPEPGTRLPLNRIIVVVISSGPILN
ncbi:PASTA domain-containing protein [Mycolicibacterium vinylchloridicum]|uniref:PASTA domain-containing protein n=1 Tax=Mycolicibacterium vinylchloridicum TaxID=2736928 RepID=UPI0015CC212D